MTKLTQEVKELQMRRTLTVVFADNTMSCFIPNESYSSPPEPHFKTNIIFQDMAIHMITIHKVRMDVSVKLSPLIPIYFKGHHHGSRPWLPHILL